MLCKAVLAALWVAGSLVHAAPAATEKASGLRLIKTSASDSGTWVSEEDKITKYRAKNVNFVDITDIKDPDTLKRLDGKDGGDTARVTYPTSVSHQTEANTYIAKANTSGPQSWLKTLTECVVLWSRCCNLLADVPLVITIVTIVHHMARNLRRGCSTR